MDPYEKLWLFYAWAHKNNLKIDSMKDQAILIGAFSNLEMAKQMSKGPDYQLSDEDFESSWQHVQSQPSPEALAGIKEGAPIRRRRKVVD